MKNKHKEERIKGNIKDRTDLILFLLFCVFTLSFSVGYAAINEELNISGEASFRVEEEIRITNVELYETVNMGIENYQSKYGKNSIILGVALPNINSTVTYKVELINSGTVPMWIDSITQELNNNSNMEYLSDGIGIKELINPGDIKEFSLTIKYKDDISIPSNKTLDTMLRFNFIKPTSTLALGVKSDSTSKFFNNGPITKESVETITFLPTLEVGEGAIGYWDASEKQDKTVIAWYTDNDNDNLYELNIGGIDGVYANPSTNSKYLFSNFKNVSKINSTNYLKTNNLTTMEGMFLGCESLTDIDLSTFDTSLVRNMYLAFQDCKNLVNLNIDGFKTNNVTNFGFMFNGCSKLLSVNTSGWDTSKVTTMEQMFFRCKNLKDLKVDLFDTSNVTSMKFMFSSIALENLDLRHFDTGNVTDFSFMFQSCSSLKSLDVSSFNIKNAEYMNSMFVGCSSLTSLDLNNFTINNVTDINSMFSGCSSLENIKLDNFDTSKVTNMGALFKGCLSLNKLNLSMWNVNNVTEYTPNF